MFRYEENFEFYVVIVIKSKNYYLGLVISHFFASRGYSISTVLESARDCYGIFQVSLR